MIERANETEADVLATFYHDLAGWLVMEPFTVEEVMATSQDGMRLPAGITCFVISLREL